MPQSSLRWTIEVKIPLQLVSCGVLVLDRMYGILHAFFLTVLPYVDPWESASLLFSAPWLARAYHIAHLLTAVSSYS